MLKPVVEYDQSCNPVDGNQGTCLPTSPLHTNRVLKTLQAILKPNCKVKVQRLDFDGAAEKTDHKSQVQNTHDCVMDTFEPHIASCLPTIDSGNKDLDCSIETLPESAPNTNTLLNNQTNILTIPKTVFNKDSTILVKQCSIRLERLNFSQMVETKAESNTSSSQLSEHLLEVPNIKTIPVELESLEPVDFESPEKVELGSPERVELGSPEKVELGSPERVELEVPAGVESKAPERVELESPERVELEAPETAYSGELLTDILDIISHMPDDDLLTAAVPVDVSNSFVEQWNDSMKHSTLATAVENSVTDETVNSSSQSVMQNDLFLNCSINTNEIGMENALSFNKTQDKATNNSLPVKSLLSGINDATQLDNTMVHQRPPASSISHASNFTDSSHPDDGTCATHSLTIASENQNLTEHLQLKLKELRVMVEPLAQEVLQGLQPTSPTHQRLAQQQAHPSVSKGSPYSEETDMLSSTDVLPLKTNLTEEQPLLQFSNENREYGEIQSSFSWPVQTSHKFSSLPDSLEHVSAIKQDKDINESTTEEDIASTFKSTLSENRSIKIMVPNPDSQKSSTSKQYCKKADKSQKKDAPELEFCSSHSNNLGKCLDSITTDSEIAKQQLAYQIHQPANEIHQIANEIHQPANEIHQPANEIHQIANQIHQPANEIHQIANERYQVANKKDSKKVPNTLCHKRKYIRNCGPVDLKQQLIGTSRSRTHLSRMLQVDGSPGSSSAESDTETTKLSKPCNTTTTNTTTTSDFGLFDCETDDDWIDFRKSAVKSIETKTRLKQSNHQPNGTQLPPTTIISFTAPIGKKDAYKNKPLKLIAPMPTSSRVKFEVTEQKSSLKEKLLSILPKQHTIGQPATASFAKPAVPTPTPSCEIVGGKKAQKGGRKTQKKISDTSHGAQQVGLKNVAKSSSTEKRKYTKRLAINPSAVNLICKPSTSESHDGDTSLLKGAKKVKSHSALTQRSNIVQNSRRSNSKHIDAKFHPLIASLCYIPMDPTRNTSSVDLCSKKESTFADADRKEIISRLLSDLTNHIHCSYNHKACSSYYCSSTIRKYRFPFQTGKLAGFPTDNMKDDVTQICSELLLDIRNLKKNQTLHQKVKHSRHGVRSKPTAHVLKKQTLKPSGKSKLSLRKQSAAAAVAAGDQSEVVRGLLSQMVSRVVCNHNHRSCAAIPGCDRPDNNVYLNAAERLSLHPAHLKAGPALSIDSDDVTVVTSDLLTEIANRVSCKIDHTTCTGVSCHAYSNVYKQTFSKKPKPSRKKLVKAKVAVLKSQSLKRLRHKNGKAYRNVKVAKAKNSAKRAPVPERWSDKDDELSVTENSASEWEATPTPARKQSRRKSALASTSSAKEKVTEGGETSGREDEDSPQPTDSKGVTVLPDLAVDIVLAQTSSDEEDITEPDSAGEIHPGRRKTLRRKKKVTKSKEERDKEREVMIARRRSKLKYMGTPRSLVLAQLIQEEAQKQCAQILLPKNLPVYEPEPQTTRPFLFPLDLSLTPSDISDIVHQIFPPHSLPAGLDLQTLVSEMCDVQSSAAMPDAQLLYQLCMYITTLTTDSSPLHRLLLTISKYSHSADLRCPLPACSSGVFDNWGQVGTHLLLHLPPVYEQLMSQAFRCLICCKGFPTSYHHKHHHLTTHSDESYTPAMLVGFSSNELRQLWGTQDYAKMVLADWSVNMAAPMREAVADYSHFCTDEVTLSTPIPPSSPLPTAVCCLDTEGSCQNTADQAQLNAESASVEKTTPSMYSNSVISNLHIDEGVEQSISYTGPDLPAVQDSTPCQHDSDGEDKKTCLEEAADTMPVQLVAAVKEKSVSVPLAYICWYCGRPFVGRSVFYLHLLQELLAMPARGVLGGCEFEGVEDTAHCGVCDTDVEVSGLEQHLSYHHSSEEIKDGGAEDNYSKREKQCPHLCCTEVFSHWSDLGNHVINTHTPQHMKSLIRHKCTACKEVFLSYYHARSHWEQNAKTCGTGARSIAAESFVAHNLSLDYLTVHHLCSHDFSFTKYKKFTFCSTFKTSHFLLCFVCQRLFSTDAKDLEKASLDEAVESLQQILSDHLRASHQITLTTGYESPPLSYSVSDKEDDGMYDHATDVEEEAAKEIEKPTPEGTSELLVPVKCEQKDPSKANSPVTPAPVSLVKKSSDERVNRTSSKVKKHKAKKSPINENSLVNSSATTKSDGNSLESSDTTYCGIHSNHRYSIILPKYCLRCKKIKDWIELMGWQKQYSFAMNFAMRGAKRHCKVHAKGIVAVHCRHRHLSYCIECSEVARPVKLQPNYYCDTHGPIYKAVSSKPICAVCETKLKPYPTAQKPAPKVKQRNLEPSSKSDKLKVIPAAEQTVKTSEPIKKAPANWQLKGAILTSLKCNIHPTVSLHLCEDVNSMQMLICRKCRALGYTFSSLSGQSTLQVLPSENCESHPESAVHAVAGSDAKFCSSCASAQLNTDVFCRFHTDAVLVYSSCGKVVAACGMCRDIPLELKPKESRVMQPNSRLFCGMHPNSSITITSAKQIYCNSCRQGATTSTPPLPEVPTSASTSGDIPSDISKQDLALCYSLFQEKEASMESIESATICKVQNTPSDDQKCGYIEDSGRLMNVKLHSVERVDTSLTPSDSKMADVKESHSPQKAGERKWKPGQCLPCMYCSDTLISFKKYKHHLKKRHAASKIPPVYACPKCRFITLFEMQYEEHAQMHGRKDVHVCSGCDYRTPKVEQMTKHLRYNCRIKGDASIVARRCSECRFVAWSSKTFDEHRATHLVRNSSKTSPSKKLCSEKDSSQPESSAAMPAKADQGKAKWRIGHKYYCKLSKQCGHASSSQLDHKNHVKKKHPGEVPRKLTPCNICYFVSDGVAAAEKHRVLHADSSSIQCTSCFSLAANANLHTTHLRYCPSQKKLNRSSSRKQEFREGQVYSCRFCDKLISNHSEYYQHHSEHHPDQRSIRLFPCPQCNYVADQKTTLVEHMRLHALPDTIECTRCHLLALPKGCGLRIHLRKSWCGKYVKPPPLPTKSTRPDDPKRCLWRKKHIYQCRHCPSKINSRHDYTIHMKTMHPHEPVKIIYPCNQCSFITDQLLLHNLHQDKHTPQGTYTCKLCNKSLTNRIQWVLHKKRCKELQRDAKESGVSAKSSPVDSQDWKKEHKFFCRHCNSLLTTSDEYTEHMAFSHKDEELRTLYPCFSCSHVTDDDAEYAAHTQCHVTSEKLTCSRCFFICQDEAILLQHQKRCLKEEPDSQKDSSNLDAASMEIDSTESLPEQEKTDAVPVSATQLGSSTDQQEGKLIAPVDKKELLSENILPIQNLAGEDTNLQPTPNATTTISPDTQEKPNNSVRLQEAPVAGKTVTSEHVVVPPTSAEVANESVTSEHVVVPPTSAKVDGSSNPTINVKENLSQVSEKRVDHIFYCRYCYYVISDLADYKSHMAKKHADKYCSGVVHYCPKCRFVTDLPQNYKHHMARHNVHELLKCDVCYYLAPSQMSLRKHFQSFCCPAAKIAADSKIVVVRNVRSKSQLNVTESQSDGGRASGSEGLGCHKETIGKSSDTLKAEKPDIIDDSRGVAPATINNFAEPETDDDVESGDKPSGRMSGVNQVDQSSMEVGVTERRRDVDVDSGEVCEDTSAELPSGLEDVSSSSKTDSLQTPLVDSDSKPSEAPAQGDYQKVNDEQVSKALIDANKSTNTQPESCQLDIMIKDEDILVCEVPDAQADSRHTYDNEGGVPRVRRSTRSSNSNSALARKSNSTTSQQSCELNQSQVRKTRSQTSLSSTSLGNRESSKPKKQSKTEKSGAAKSSKQKTKASATSKFPVIKTEPKCESGESTLNSDSQKTAKLVDYSKQSAQLAATAAAPVDNGSGITLNDEVFTKKHSMTIGDVSGETAVFNKVLLEGFRKDDLTKPIITQSVISLSSKNLAQVQKFSIGRHIRLEKLAVSIPVDKRQDYTALDLPCNSCNTKVRGIKHILTHGCKKSENKDVCYVCAKVFPGENYTDIHLACVHLEIPYDEYVEWLSLGTDTNPDVASAAEQSQEHKDRVADHKSTVPNLSTTPHRIPTHIRVNDSPHGKLGETPDTSLNKSLEEEALPSDQQRNIRSLEDRRQSRTSDHSGCQARPSQRPSSGEQYTDSRHVKRRVDKSEPHLEYRGHKYSRQSHSTGGNTDYRRMKSNVGRCSENNSLKDHRKPAEISRRAQQVAEQHSYRSSRHSDDDILAGNRPRLPASHHRHYSRHDDVATFDEHRRPVPRRIHRSPLADQREYEEQRYHGHYDDYNDKRYMRHSPAFTERSYWARNYGGHRERRQHIERDRASAQRTHHDANFSHRFHDRKGSPWSTYDVERSSRKTDSESQFDLKHASSYVHKTDADSINHIKNRYRYSYSKNKAGAGNRRGTGRSPSQLHDPERDFSKSQRSLKDKTREESDRSKTHSLRDEKTSRKVPHSNGRQSSHEGHHTPTSQEKHSTQSSKDDLKTTMDHRPAPSHSSPCKGGQNRDGDRKDLKLCSKSQKDDKNRSDRFIGRTERPRQSEAKHQGSPGISPTSSDKFKVSPTSQSSARSKRPHSDDQTDKKHKRRRESSPHDQELVMTTHDGQIVRLKPSKGGTLELA